MSNLIRVTQISSSAWNGWETAREDDTLKFHFERLKFYSTDGSGIYHSGKIFPLVVFPCV